MTKINLEAKAHVFQVTGWENIPSGCYFWFPPQKGKVNEIFWKVDEEKYERLCFPGVAFDCMDVMKGATFSVTHQLWVSIHE